MFALHRVLLASLLTGAPLAALASPLVTVVPVLQACAVLDEDAADLAAAVWTVRSTLATEGLDAPITARVKAPESLAAKAARKGVAPDDLLDRLAMRVHVDEVAACYAVRALLHERFSVIPGSVDDYIAVPKANGYRSLHSALIIEGSVVEVQVRTHAMHAHAEHGPAAHWRYKQSQAVQLG